MLNLMGMLKFHMIAFTSNPNPTVGFQSFNYFITLHFV